MSRWHCAVVLASSLAVLSGCQSGPLAQSNKSSASAGGSQSLDPRIAGLDQSGSIADKLLGRSDNKVSKEYAEAKKVLKQPEKLMLLNAQWKESVGKPAALEEARAIYTTILQDNSESVDAMIGLARVDHQADRLEDAERLFRSILTRYPTHATAITEAAKFYNDTDRPNEAMAILRPAIQADPEHRGLREKMGIALVKSGQPEQAIPHFTKCVGTASALFNVGRLLAEQQHTDEARQYLRRAIERNPEFEAARTLMATLDAPSGVQHASANRGATPHAQQAEATNFGTWSEASR